MWIYTYNSYMYLYGYVDMCGIIWVYLDMIYLQNLNMMAIGFHEYINRIIGAYDMDVYCIRRYRFDLVLLTSQTLSQINCF